MALIFAEQRLAGCFVIEPEFARDERGFFARTYSRTEFDQRAIAFAIAQVSVSHNARRGTLRGMHLQLPPHEEAKLVRCVSGRVHDVVVDLRAGSPTQLEWLGVELTAERRNALYVPTGMAHGFVTLEDACELEYLLSSEYVAEAAVGIRWNDPAIGIEWPLEPNIISARDRRFRYIDADAVRRGGPTALAATRAAP